MISDRKKPGVAFWATVVVVVAVVYVLSWGPATMLARKSGGGTWLSAAVDCFYAPLYWALYRSPQPIVHVYNVYFIWWQDLILR